jgi:protein gp37
MPTKIEWCRNPDGTPGESWSPIAMRCTPVSEGCLKCWHLRFTKRHASNEQICPKHRAAAAGGAPWLNPVALKKPLHWKRPRMVAVQLMGDLFHESVPHKYVIAIMDIIQRCPQHTFLFLTKRVDSMKMFFGGTSGAGLSAPALPNLWLGWTAENQARWDERTLIGLSIPAAKFFVSVEPMLGPINTNGHRPDWVLCGAEQGPGARHMPQEWMSSLENQCRKASIPFFLKKVSKGETTLFETRQFPSGYLEAADAR